MTEKILEDSKPVHMSESVEDNDESILRSALEGMSDELLTVSHHIHERPETRFQEFFAADLLTSELREAGFAVESGIGGLETSFRAEASFGEGGPTIAFVCEYDALEKIGHGCGHNIIATVGLGGALITKHLMEQDGSLSGRIVVIGTPGEEGGGGKAYMVQAGCFDDLDAALMIHPGGENLSAMSTLGRVAMTFEFTGKAAHAAVNPELGVNALDASVLTLNAIGLLRQQLPTSARVHAVIEDGGEVPNIIPERSFIRVFVRAPETEMLLNNLIPRIIDCARGAALATGCVVDVDLPTPVYAALNSNPVLGRLIEANFASLGRNTVPLLTEAFPGSTDMGNVSQIIPVIHPNVELQPGVNMHSHEATELAGGPSGDQAALDGALLLALTAAQLFRSPELLAEVKEAFVPGLRLPARISNLEDLKGLI